MSIEYSKRAITDLENIGRYYRDSAGATIAAAIETRIRMSWCLLWNKRLGVRKCDREWGTHPRQSSFSFLDIVVRQVCEP